MIINDIKRVLCEITGLSEVTLTTPALEHGDFATNVALQMGVKSPREKAEELVKLLQNHKEIKKSVCRIEVAGAGFINFFLSDTFLKTELLAVVREDDAYGRSTSQKDKKYIIEYSSPNIAKPFTVGHLRSTIIGDAIANVLEFSGAQVFRDNHLGDWGTQFGKQIYAIKTWGDEKAIEDSENPVKELVSLYVRFHEEAEKDPTLEDHAREWFKKLEEGDPEAKRLWQKCVEWSYKEFDEIYKKLGISFTENNGRGFGESFFEDKMAVVLTELEKKGLLEMGEEGAKIVQFENDKYPPLLIVKKDGASLYSTRDLAADYWRRDTYGDDIIILNEVGGEQALYWKQIFEIERRLGWFRPEQRIHIKHGLFRFADKKMSTRKGNVIWLADVLDQAFIKAQEMGTASPQTASEIAVGALKWTELKRDPIHDIVFDWNEILNMKGNSGPYMQYTVVRINSLISKSSLSGLESIPSSAHTLARSLVKFPEVVRFAAQTYKPSYLSEYLFGLAQQYNAFYDSNRIIGNDQERDLIAVSKATQIVIENGLQLLGIQIPQKM